MFPFKFLLVGYGGAMQADLNAFSPVGSWLKPTVRIPIEFLHRKLYRAVCSGSYGVLPGCRVPPSGMSAQWEGGVKMFKRLKTCLFGSRFQSIFVLLLY
jgi:hypothetical protein